MRTWTADALVKVAAMACTFLGQVAVKNNVCRLEPPRAPLAPPPSSGAPVSGHRLTISRMVGSKPISSIWSASSRTRYDTASNEIEGEMPRLGSPPHKSFKRPGVAMTMSAPCLSAPTCGPFGVPPYNTTTRARAAGANFSASPAICSANSRVGATTRTLGRAGSDSRHDNFLGVGAGPRSAMRARAGKRNPHVLPLPVFATATMSWPAKAIGQDCA
mmetsp:Transcript_14569/g.37069  ORF Transcript_14569/g.37069 Transcript_14569/m.37069 type:complete len:217 (+) Transcript_14569:740-1390(+)